jgi:hypothetical protein
LSRAVASDRPLKAMTTAVSPGRPGIGTLRARATIGKCIGGGVAASAASAGAS